MREIKFKAFDKRNNRMCEHVEIYAPFDDDATVEGQGKNGEAIIIDRKDLILMQYTGLKDKNGKDIYEDDIIFDARIQETGKIVFGKFKTMESSLGLHELSPKFCIYWADKSGHSQIKYFDTEVIGNIHESPELLK